MAKIPTNHLCITSISIHLLESKEDVICHRRKKCQHRNMRWQSTPNTNSNIMEGTNKNLVQLLNQYLLVYSWNSHIKVYWLLDVIILKLRFCFMGPKMESVARCKKLIPCNMVYFAWLKVVCLVWGFPPLNYADNLTMLILVCRFLE